jgi:hypothetical protein
VLSAVLAVRADPPKTEEERAAAAAKLRDAFRPKQGRGVVDGSQEAVAWLLPPTPAPGERSEVAEAVAQALAEQLGTQGGAEREDVLSQLARGEARPTVPVALGGEKVVVLSPATVSAMMAEPEGAAAATTAERVGADAQMAEPANTLRLLAPRGAGRCPRWFLPGGVIVTTCEPVGMTTFPGFGTLEQFERPFP